MLGRIFIGPDSQTWMHAISSVRVDETDNSYVETTYGVTRMCSNKLHASVFKAFVSANYCTFVCFETTCVSTHRCFHVSYWSSESWTFHVALLLTQNFTIHYLLIFWQQGAWFQLRVPLILQKNVFSVFFSKTCNEKPVWSKITWMFFFLHWGSSTCAGVNSKYNWNFH